MRDALSEWLVTRPERGPMLPRSDLGPAWANSTGRAFSV